MSSLFRHLALRISPGSDANSRYWQFLSMLLKENRKAKKDMKEIPPTNKMMNKFNSGGKGRDWGVGDIECSLEYSLGIEYGALTQGAHLPLEARQGDIFVTPPSTNDDFDTESDEGVSPPHDLDDDGELMTHVWVYGECHLAYTCAHLYDLLCERYTWNLETFNLYCHGLIPYCDDPLWEHCDNYDAVDVFECEPHRDYPHVVSLQSQEYDELRSRLRARIARLAAQRLPARFRPVEQSKVADALYHDAEHYRFQFGDKTVEVNVPLWIEALSCLGAQLKSASEGRDCFNAVCAFIRTVTGRSVAIQFATKIVDFMLWCANVEVDVEEAPPIPMEREMDPNDVEDVTYVFEQSSPGIENPFANFRAFFNSVDSVRDSPGMRKMQDLFMYLVSNSVLDKIGVTMERCDFTAASRAYYRERYKLGFGFVYSVLDGVSFILEKVYTAWVTKDIGAMWHTEAVYDRFADEYAQIKIDALGLCNPDAFDLNYHSFVSRVDACVADGNRIVKFVTKKDKPRIQAILYELEKLRATEIIQKAAARGRRMPFGVLLHGPSGVLKTTLEDILGTHYGRVRSLPLGHDYRYTIVPTAEFMSGFTSKMWWLKIDDAAAIRPGVIGDLDPSIRDILQIYNNAGWCPPQAELELKGKTPCYAEFASITTNTKDLNAQHYFNNDIAIRRRCILHIDVNVKEQYRIVGSTRADTSKIPEPRDGEYPNIWDLVVQEVYERRENGISRADLRTIYRTENIYDFLRFYTSKIQQHAYEQDMQRKTAQIIRNVPSCKLCYLPEVACECVESLPTEQSFELADCAFMTAMMSLQVCVFLWILSRLSARVEGLVPQMIDSGKRAAVEMITEAASDPLAGGALRSVASAVRNHVEAETAAVCQDVKTMLREALVSARNTYLLPMKKLVGAITAAAGMYLVYRWSQERSGSQGEDSVEIPTQVPTADGQEPNVWFNSNYVTSELDRGCPPPASQYEAILARIQRNTGHVVARRNVDGRVYATRGNILCVGGQLYVGNKHVLIRDSDEVELTVRFDENIGISESVTVKLARSEFYLHPTLDLAFVIIGALPPRKKLTQFMAEHNANFGVCDGAILHTREDGRRDINPVRAGKCDLNWTVAQWTNVPCWKVKPSQPTVVGDCGAPYLMKTQKGPLLAGIHFAGSLAHSYGLMLSREICDEANRALDHVVVEQGTVDLRDVDGSEVVVAPLHEKSVFRYIEQGQARVFGSFVGFRAKHVSRIQKTHIYDEIIQSGYPDNFGPPEMKGWEIWRNAVLPVVTQPLLANRSEFNLCADAYLSDILNSLPEKWLSVFKPLDDVSVVNGYPGAKFIDALNKNTSMGFPWRKKKLAFLHPVVPPIEPYMEQWEFDNDFMDRVGRIRKAHLRGEMAHPIFTAHMKDEPRKWKRVLSKDTRQMSGCPADFLFHTRQYLLTFVQIFQSNSELFEGAPGINHRSLSWDTLFHYLTAFGQDQMVAGDFKHYDKGMQAVVLTSVFRVIYKFALACGWDEVQARVLLCIGYDLTFVFMDFNGDLVQFFGSNASGHCVTVIVNCIANSIYGRFVYRRCGFDVETFKSNVHLMTYGDDNIMGISPDASDVFNHTSLMTTLADIGVIYTMADKDAESVPLVSIWETTFLKRGWRFEPELGSIVAPIEETSIGKMLTRCLPSDVLCPEAHACEVILNALTEYSLYGRSRYNEERRRLSAILDRQDLRDYLLRPIPTFDELLDALKLKYGSCQCDSESVYFSHPKYRLIESWESGENYIVVPKSKPKCSPFQQLLRVGFEHTDVSVGCMETCEGDPRNSCLGKLPAGEQESLTSMIANGFSDRSCIEQPPEMKKFEQLELIEVQSEPVTDTTVVASELVTEENLTFSGGTETTPVMLPGSVSMMDQGIDQDSVGSLGRFLQRPVMIASFTWNEDSVLAPQYIAPWRLYFDTVQIENKLTNYARLRCRLKVRFILNASPFYSGSLRASYFPLEPFGGERSIFGSAASNLIRYSQPPGVYLEPQTMSSAEMTLPFVWEGDWLNTADAESFSNMGIIGIVQYARLLSANDVTGTGVTVRVYAWAEDVEIAGLTVEPVMQSDEYEEEQGVISAPASAVGRVARLAANVPMLAPYARAAEFGANAVSGVAKLFGYSNPPVIEDSMPVTVKSFHAMANTDTRVPLDVLAIDPKNELALSSSVNGYSGEDELSIVYLCGRESFLLGSTWTSTTPLNGLIFSSTVHPGLTQEEPVGVIHTTPMAYFSEMFQYWRGGLKFKFRFIKTKYHRGRVLISWDPNSNITSTSDTETATLSRVVDIENETEVEMIVPYKASLPYLNCRLDQEVSSSLTPTISMDRTFHNGTITMRVQNALTGPAATPQITVLMFVSACEDFEFQVPNELNDAFTIWPLEQSQPVLEEQSPQATKGQVTMGEKVASIRSILHRSSLWSTQVLGAMYDESNVLYNSGWRRTHNLVKRVPTGYGYNLDGANWTSVPANQPFSYNKNHPIDWVLNVFAAYKGSTNITVNVSRGNTISGNASEISELSASRYFTSTVIRPTKQNRTGSTDFNSTAVSSSISRSVTINAAGAANAAVVSGRTGVSLTNTATQAALQVHVPQYVNRRLLVAWGRIRNADFTQGGFVYENVDIAANWFQQATPAATMPWPLIDIYYSAGTDFNPFFFVCTPRLYTLASPAAQNSSAPPP